MKNTNRHLSAVLKFRIGCLGVIVGERGEELNDAVIVLQHHRKIHRHRIQLS